ncbi:glutamate--tRNA ligase [Actomonas aquatica]|uniref:Glutamate--tRNA ligase n=1 Tax=Actomonas aquatica TaxID=2866162 RepID=A0ABZ1C8K9_9BACT|nr:glutamate--tRNA ligase family protein [Opitutus sp. WL0086]WRQ88034.1 glutamate--tRNA ligase family protein [Opitutus sp. WL0086]
MSQVRVRFAPSPTGFFHIGSARTALFNWLYARHTGGTFILRVEDTDKERNSEAFLNVIYDSMRWLGLNWDEGPHAGGDCGPYRQSERAHIYTEYLEKLRAAGRVYEQDGATWFKISGEPQVIEDAIRGRVERTEEKDFVIIRSDGNPVFHFVNVVDDISMGVTHVIRGEDHLSNTSKHTELFKAFGAPLPTFAHIPLILKQDGPGKMSKRDKGALIEEYQNRGYLPEAVVNFLCLLGWNPKDDSEKMPIAEIIERFDFPGVNQSNARFDERKMAHMNMQYLLEMPPADYLSLAQSYFSRSETHAAVMQAADEAYFAEVIAISQPKVKAIDELPDYTVYFFTEEFPWNDKAIKKVFKKGEPLERLAELRELIAGDLDLNDETGVEEAIKTFAETKGFGFGDYQAVARLAVTGTNAGPGLTQIFRVLGKDKVVSRMGHFLANPPSAE